MPPRHGKSETTSKYTPAWYLGAAGAQGDPRQLPGAVRRVVGTQGARSARGARRGDLRCRVSRQLGGAASGRSPATGGGMSPPASAARSPARAPSCSDRRPDKNSRTRLGGDPPKQWDWWLARAHAAAQGRDRRPVMTRWHEDDLAGRLLAQDAGAADDEREGWKVIEFPAIAEPDPDTGELYDALGREPGQALCPELGYDEAWAKRTRAAVGVVLLVGAVPAAPAAGGGAAVQAARLPVLGAAPDRAGADLLHEDAGIRTQSLGALHAVRDRGRGGVGEADGGLHGDLEVGGHPDPRLMLIDRHRQRFEILDVGGFVKTAHETGELTSLPDHILWPGGHAPGRRSRTWRASATA
jgi:hypothetical protein